ncbi:hypothetical protein D918_05672 [Trichuris suis]|nr:hypothetical protein D918_05672 [Trichuris suis]
MLFFVILLLPTVAHGVPKEFKFIETKDVVRIGHPYPVISERKTQTMKCQHEVSLHDHLYSRMQKLAESFKVETESLKNSLNIFASA